MKKLFIVLCLITFFSCSDTETLLIEKNIEQEAEFKNPFSEKSEETVHVPDLASVSSEYSVRSKPVSIIKPQGTYATVFGGGLNSGFSVPVKAFASVGYFISGIFEPSLFTFGGGLTPSFAFHFGENKEFSFGISPLEGFVRIDYRSHPVVTKFGLNASVQFDFKNAYCRISGGGTFDREPVMILSAGFRWDFPVSARRMI